MNFTGWYNFDKKADEAPIEFVKFLKQVRTITFPISSAKFLFFQLQDGATNARSDDVSRIMNVVAIWINQHWTFKYYSLWSVCHCIPHTAHG